MIGKAFHIDLKPGAVSANGDINLPGWAPKISKLLAVKVKRKNSITWSGLGAAGATIATDDVAAAGSGSDTIAEAAEKTIIQTGTPAAGEAIKVDEDTIHIGDAIADGDLVILDYIPKGAIRAIGFN